MEGQCNPFRCTAPSGADPVQPDRRRKPGGFDRLTDPDRNQFCFTALACVFSSGLCACRSHLSVFTCISVSTMVFACYLLQAQRGCRRQARRRPGEPAAVDDLDSAPPHDHVLVSVRRRRHSPLPPEPRARPLDCRREAARPPPLSAPPPLRLRPTTKEHARPRRHPTPQRPPLPSLPPPRPCIAPAEDGVKLRREGRELSSRHPGCARDRVGD